MRNIAVYPGFNENILKALEKKLGDAPANSKVVPLVFDEMAIKEGVSYDNGRDLIEGFAEGKERGTELANHAVSFMVRGIRQKWKQPVGYFLSSGPMSGADIKDLLFECISKLKSIGLTVAIIICDQGSNNTNVFEKHLNVTKETLYFYHESDKVFAMYV